MQTKDKRDQIKSWFVPEPKLQAVFLIIAAVFIFLGIGIGDPTFRLGFAACGAILGGITYYGYTKAKARYDARPPTQQMTQWLQEDLEALKEKSLEKMRLDESETIAETLILKGPIWWAIPGLDQKEILRGNTGNTDGQGYLYSFWDIVILHIGENSLAVYKCAYNWPRNHPTNEGTSEYFYQDIVAVKTGSESLTKPLLETDKKLSIGCGCLGYLNPYVFTRLLLNQFISLLQAVFGDSFNLELPEFLEFKRKDGELHVEGKVFNISMSSGESMTYLIDSQQLEIWGAEEVAAAGDRAVAAISRRLRDKKAS